MKPVFLTRGRVEAVLGLTASTVGYHTRMGQLRTLRMRSNIVRIEARGLVPNPGVLPTRGVLTVPQVADLLELCPKTVYRLARCGEIPMACRLGQWSIHASVLARWVDEHTDGQHMPMLVDRARERRFADRGAP